MGFRELQLNEEYVIPEGFRLATDTDLASPEEIDKITRGTEYTDFDSGKSGLVFTGKELTGEMDVRGIAGERPIEREVDTFIDLPESANFGVAWKANFADDLQTQIRVFAPVRFPDLDPKEAMSKYETSGGKIYFKDDDGFYKEENSTSFKKLLATTSGRDLPAAVGGVLGTITGNPLIVGLTTAGGEGWRKVISSLWLDEPQTTTDNMIDMAIEGTLGVLSEYGGRVITGGVNRVAATGKTDGKKLYDIIKRKRKIQTKKELSKRGANKIGFAPVEDPEKIQHLLQIANDYDIPIDAAALTGNPDLVDRLNVLAEISDTADMVTDFKKTQNLKLKNGVDDFLDTIGTEKDPFQVGEQVSEAAEKAVRGIDADRRKIVSPMYIDAFKTSPTTKKIIRPAMGTLDKDGKPLMKEISRYVQVNDQPILDVINNALELELANGTPSHNALVSIQSAIQKADGNLQKLHNIAVEDMDVILRRELEGVKTKVQGNNLSHYMGRVKKALSKQLDENREYVAAKAMHELLVPESTAARLGLTGNIARLKGDDVSAVVTRLFSSNKANPTTIKKAKNLIRKQNPEAWDDAIRTFMQFRFSKVSDAVVSDSGNMGAMFKKAFWGNKFQRDNLKAAMSPDQFQATEDFMDVISATGLTFAKDGASPTARKIIKAETGGLAFDLFGSQFKPLVTPEKLLFQKVRSLASGKGQRELTEVLLDPRAAVELSRLKQLTPKSEELIRQFSIFLGVNSPETIETIRNNQLTGDTP